MPVQAGDSCSGESDAQVHFSVAAGQQQRLGQHGSAGARRRREPKTRSFSAIRPWGGAGAQKARQATALWMPNVGLQATAAYVGMRNETRDAAFSAPAFGSMSGANFTTDVSTGAMTQVGTVASQPIYSGERLANSRQLQHQATLADLQFRADDQQLVCVAQGY